MNLVLAKVGQITTLQQPVLYLGDGGGDRADEYLTTRSRQSTLLFSGEPCLDSNTGFGPDFAHMIFPPILETGSCTQSCVP
jgi:hypothetical protein